MAIRKSQENDTKVAQSNLRRIIAGFVSHGPNSDCLEWHGEHGSDEVYESQERDEDLEGTFALFVEVDNQHTDVGSRSNHRQYGENYRDHIALRLTEKKLNGLIISMA